MYVVTVVTQPDKIINYVLDPVTKPGITDTSLRWILERNSQAKMTVTEHRQELLAGWLSWCDQKKYQSLSNLILIALISASFIITNILFIISRKQPRGLLEIYKKKPHAHVHNRGKV